MLYIMRHGKTEWKALKKLQGRTDIPLSEEGREKTPYTSLAVNKLTYDIYDINCSTPTLCCKELLKYLNWSVFDDVRDTEEFKSVCAGAEEKCDK